MIGETAIRREARNRYADAVQAKGPAWRNAADSVRAGTYANPWILLGIDAVEATLRNPELSESDA
jgi:hypothetical protein